jgi:SsrA-binding protein
VKGHALVPLSAYWKNGRVKLAMGLGKGKVEYDRREDLKERESARELKRATMHHLKKK